MRASFARLVVTVVVLGASSSTARPAHAANAPRPVPAAQDTDGIDRIAREAYEEGKYAFCKDPTRPLGLRQQGLCELAAEVEGCEGYLKACHLGQVPKDRSWVERVAEWLGPIAKAFLYLLVLGIVVVVAIPVIRAIVKRKRDRELAERVPDAPNRAVVVEGEPVLVEEISDAEAALRLAEEHRSRGERKRALGLYLAASLAALDRRGAIRVARHRTNGEYVRGCEEEESRRPLREIVREVDEVEFGGTAPTDEGLERVAARARSIVRVTASTAIVLAIALLSSGCSAPRRGADPAGDELPIRVLERNGFKVTSLGTSLATMPIPENDRPDEGMPVVIVDVEKVPLEDEAQAHMMRWVEAGGVLVLFGHASGWPSELRPETVAADTRDLVVRTQGRDPSAGLEDSDEDEASSENGAPIEIKGARTARRDAFAWKEREPLDVENIAFLGKGIYAAKRRVGKGIVLGVANDDLFTNIGMMPPHNAAALVTLVRSVSHAPVAANGTPSSGDIRVARTEDGVPPPANPFAALVAAGLGKGTWQALAAAILLFLAYGVRQARPRAVDRKDRRAFAEHVEATAALYGLSRAYGHALGAYGRFVEMRLREIVPRGTDPALFLATRSGVDPERVAELYDRAMTAKADDAPRGDELMVIEELRRMMEKAIGSPPRPPE
jgi:hypothetical protein